jgi:hypothetical protein
MKIGKILKPGQPGTKKWLEKFGEDLLCVRYRDDKVNHRKLTTVEIIVEQRAWKINPQRIPRNKLMTIQVGYDEKNIQRLVRSAGGKWNRTGQVWQLSYGEILDLGLEQRIVKQG